jgi:hypothetical protein
MRGEAVVVEEADEDGIVARMEACLLVYDVKVANMTKLEELELYDRMTGSGRFTGPFQMYAPSLRSRKTSGSASGAASQDQGQSSASSPAAASKAGQPSDKG